MPEAYENTPLARVVRRFKLQCEKTLPDMRPITPAEVAGAMKILEQQVESKEIEIAEEYLEMIGSLLDSGEVPKGAELELTTDLGPFDGVRYKVSNVSLRFTKADESDSQVFPVRQRFVSSELVK